jgi:hypothetical protein
LTQCYRSYRWGKSYMLSRQMYESMDRRCGTGRGRAEGREAKAEGQRARRQSKNRIKGKWRTLNAVYKAKDKRHVVN